MGLFGKKKEDEQEQKRPVNPNNVLVIRLLAIGYLLYCLYEMVNMYIAGGEEAPSLGLLIGAFVLFLGGSAWIAVITLRQFKQMKQEQEAAWEEEDRLEEERLARLEEEESAAVEQEDASAAEEAEE